MGLAMNLMVPYWQLDGLDGIYLEDSYVLSIEESPSEVIFRMEFVLRESHPAYRAPQAGEQYCYRRGALTFRDLRDVQWTSRKAAVTTDAMGEVDLGNIDALSRNGTRYSIEGDWGRAVIDADSVTASLA
jgi:hypothetical protein